MNEPSEPWKWGEEPPTPKPEPINPQGERHLCCGYDGYMQAFASGDWVRYKDYEKLKSDLEKSDGVVFMQAVENEHLKAEIERLRKAGDTMLLALWLGVGEYSKEQKEKAEEVWNAAKEGKSSETKSPSFIEDLGNGVEKHDLLFRYPAKQGKPSV